MLKTQVIESFLQRVGIDDFNYGNATASATGDLVQAFDPDVSFDDVLAAINGYRPYRANIVDNGQNYIEVQDTIYVDGMQTKVSYLCGRGEMGYGTMVKVMVKSVTCVVKGQVKTFLGFGDLENFKERFVAE